MKKLITQILFLYCSSVVVAQTSVDDDYIANPKKISKDRVSASISMGAGLGFFNSTKSTVYSTFVAPKIGYQISPKFKLNIGLMHYTASGNNFTPLNSKESVLNLGNRSITGNLIFVGGEYKLNPKLIMSGSVMVDANDIKTKQNNFKAATLGFDYKISEKTSIGFRATVSQGNNDYFTNPGNGNYNHSPNNINSASSLFLSPLTQWGMENSLNPTIR
ncbi:MAG: hypothetical protein V4511_10690 [Bacteroidota bacterium]